MQLQIYILKTFVTKYFKLLSRCYFMGIYYFKIPRECNYFLFILLLLHIHILLATALSSSSNAISSLSQILCIQYGMNCTACLLFFSFLYIMTCH